MTCLQTERWCHLERVSMCVIGDRYGKLAFADALEVGLNVVLSRVVNKIHALASSTVANNIDKVIRVSLNDVIIL